MVYEPPKPMEPPTCTVVLRSVRTTGVVATWLLLPDCSVVLLWPAAAATAPATTAPARAPAATVMAATCRAVNSAIESRPDRRGLAGRQRDIPAARIDLLEDAGRGGGVNGRSSGVNLDRSGR